MLSQLLKLQHKAMTSQQRPLKQVGGNATSVPRQRALAPPSLHLSVRCKSGHMFEAAKLRGRQPAEGSGSHAVASSFRMLLVQSWTRNAALLLAPTLSCHAPAAQPSRSCWNLGAAMLPPTPRSATEAWRACRGDCARQKQATPDSLIPAC